LREVEALENENATLMNDGVEFFALSFITKIRFCLIESIGYGFENRPERSANAESKIV
jgi:hypothetical protein